MIRKANQGKVSCLVCFLTSGYADASKNSSRKRRTSAENTFRAQTSTTQSSSSNNRTVSCKDTGWCGGVGGNATQKPCTDC